MAICPCKGCEPPKREIGCHGTCEQYIGWQQERGELMKAKIKANDQIRYVVSAHKNMKKKRR